MQRVKCELVGLCATPHKAEVRPDNRPQGRALLADGERQVLFELFHRLFGERKFIAGRVQPDLVAEKVPVEEEARDMEGEGKMHKEETAVPGTGNRCRERLCLRCICGSIFHCCARLSLASASKNIYVQPYFEW